MDWAYFVFIFGVFAIKLGLKMSYYDFDCIPEIYICRPYLWKRLMLQNKFCLMWFYLARFSIRSLKSNFMIEKTKVRYINTEAITSLEKTLSNDDYHSEVLVINKLLYRYKNSQKKCYPYLQMSKVFTFQFYYRHIKYYSKYLQKTLIC